MISLDAAPAQLPIVLVVDPVGASRQALWRSLSRCFAVIEASDARGARDWLAHRSDIDALVVQRDLPDAQGSDLVKSLVTAQAAVASRSILVTNPVDLRGVLTSLTGWFYPRDAGGARARVREANRLVS